MLELNLMKAKPSRWKDLALVVCLIGLVAGTSHVVITKPMLPSRLLYFFQVPIIQWTTKCSSEAPDWMALIQQYATRNMGSPASQLALLEPSGRLHHCETGWKDGVLGHQRLSDETRFRFASLTKTVTAAAILDLVNQGQLALDDKVVDLLGIEAKLRDPRVGSITVEDLLSHRGGWDRERSQDVMFLRSSRPWCPTNPEKISETSLVYEPGEVEAYSNLGYCLLGLVIERVSGKPYRDYMQERFSFDNSSLAFVNGPYLDDEVDYDTRHEDLYTKMYYKHFDFNAISSSAGLSGNALDFAKLIGQVLTHRPKNILSRGKVGECTPDATQECFGYGVHLYQPSDDQPPLYVHEGKFPGNTTSLIIHPDGWVLVWLGAGSVGSGSDSRENFHRFVYEVLIGAAGDK